MHEISCRVPIPRIQRQGGERTDKMPRSRPQLRRCENDSFAAMERDQGDTMTFSFRVPNLTMPGTPPPAHPGSRTDG